MTLIPSSIPYLPLLELKPAEMLALQELPEKVKDGLFPSFRLKRWVTSDRLERSIERLTQAFGGRPAILELSGFEFVEARRDVHDQLDRLRNPEDGYLNWANYFESQDLSQFVPSAQIGPPAAMLPQLDRLARLGRGVSIRLTRDLFPALGAILGQVKQVDSEGGGFLLILDLGIVRGSTVLQDAEWVASAATQARASLPKLRIAVAGSSFPSNFVGLGEQDIHERSLFRQASTRTEVALIYGDHGSARVESQMGGGGMPAPRIDYATANRWFFFRDDSGGDRLACYETQARNCMESDAWDSRLQLWGRQMIERTALGDENAVVTPARATAVRINLHLHQQLFFGDPSGLYDTDESWSD